MALRARLMQPAFEADKEAREQAPSAPTPAPAPETEPAVDDKEVMDNVDDSHFVDADAVRLRYQKVLKGTADGPIA